jgi:hypothetical protein
MSRTKSTVETGNWHIFSIGYIVLSRGGFLIKPEIIPTIPDLDNASAGTREKRY